MNESQEPVTKEMWYNGQIVQAKQIKHLRKEIVKLIELVEQLIRSNT